MRSAETRLLYVFSEFASSERPLKVNGLKLLKIQADKCHGSLTVSTIENLRLFICQEEERTNTQ